MWQVGYQPEGESRGWWKLAQHIDEAKGALVNAMAHNLDDQTAVFALQEKLREAQVILLWIFQKKGLVAPPAEIVPSVPQGAPMEMPQPPVAEASPSWAETSTEIVPSMEAEPSISVVPPPETVPAVSLEDPLTGMLGVPV
jgi:hypothetical protein